jgi:YHS domain-containing protein
MEPSRIPVSNLGKDDEDKNMSLKNQKTFGLLLLILLFVASLGVASAEASEPGLRKAEVKKVCMVNDQFMGKDQIPVEVEGKTYYGCCAMCKEKLAKDPASRYSTDPVSGARVDKAKAVIGVLPDGAALYFENEANFNKYASKSQK